MIVKSFKCSDHENVDYSDKHEGNKKINLTGKWKLILSILSGFLKSTVVITNINVQVIQGDFHSSF